jgi:hypothetical protein
MFRRRCARVTTALLVALSLLFSQLALASYACPGQQDAAMAGMMAAGMPCEGMDANQPVLCHEHSAGATQAVEALKAPAPGIPFLVQVLAAPLVLAALEAVAVPAGAEPDARPPPDPLFLATLRLRV